MDKTYLDNISGVDLRLMLICSLRYAMTRQTYITSVAVEWVEKYKSILSNQDKVNLVDEIDFNISIGLIQYTNLGNWSKVKELLIEEIDK